MSHRLTDRQTQNSIKIAFQTEIGMPLDRRGFLNLAAAGIATTLLTSTPPVKAAAKPKIKAIVFDGFALWDPRPIFALAEQLFPGRGADLSNAWRTRQENRDVRKPGRI